MLTKHSKLGALLIAVVFAMGLMAFPMAISAVDVYENPVANPGFEDAEGAVPTVGANIQDAGIVTNTIPLTDAGTIAYTHDSTKAFKAKFVGVDGSRYAAGGSSPNAWLPLTEGHYVEFPIPGLTIVKNASYSISYRAINIPGADPVLGGDSHMIARLNWSANPTAQHQGYNTSGMYEVDASKSWKIPFLKGQNHEINVANNADISDVTKLQFHFSKLNRKAVDGVQTELGGSRTMLFDDIYVAPTRTASGAIINPVVVSSTPEHMGESATAVSSIFVNFNYKMDKSRLVKSNFTAKDGDNQTIAIDEVVMAADAMSAEVKLVSPVSSGSVSLSMNNSIRDVFARAISPTTITFSIGQSPPVLASAVPADKATGVLPNIGVARLTFNKDLDATRVNTTNITSDDAAIDSVSLVDDRVIEIVFDGLLEANKTITITLANIKGADGSEFAEALQYSFTTDVSKVDQVWPADGEKRVYIKPVVHFLFSAPVVLPALGSGVVTINGGTSLIDKIEADPDDARRFYAVLKTLSPNTTYTVDVDGVVTTFGFDVQAFQSTFTTIDDGRTNIFVNPGLENRSFTQSGKPGFDSMKGAFTTEDAHSGAYSSKMGKGGGEDWVISYNAYSVGKTYGVSAFFKITPESPESTGWVRSDFRVLYASDDTPNTVFENYKRMEGITKNEYKRLAFAFTIPANPRNANAGLNGMLWKFPATAWYYFDDLEIFEIPAALDMTEDGSIFDGATLENAGDELVIAFNREMEQNLAAGNIKINGVAAASVTPLENSVKKFLVTPAAPLTAGGNYTVSVEGAMDIYGGVYTGEFDFSVEGGELARYTFGSFATLSDGAASAIIKANSVMKASVVGLTNNTGAAGGAYLIAALYKDGMLVSTNVSNVVLADGETAAAPLEASIAVAGIDDGEYTFGAFLWEDLVKLTPIAKRSIKEFVE